MGDARVTRGDLAAAVTTTPPSPYAHLRHPPAPATAPHKYSTTPRHAPPRYGATDAAAGRGW